MTQIPTTRVRDVMTSPAITIGPNTPYGEIIHCLLSNRISGLPVVDDDGHLLGVVTETDLVFREAYPNPRPWAAAGAGQSTEYQRRLWMCRAERMTASELMASNPVVAELDDELSDTARRMVENSIDRLPVVRDSHVVGIVSRSDLLRPHDRAEREVALDQRLLGATPA